MNFDFILVFFVLRFLGKTINTKELYPRWDSAIKIALPALMILFLSGLFFKPAVPILNWVGKISMLALLYILYHVRANKNTRSVYIAILPYILISFIAQIIKDAAPEFFSKWDNLTESIELFSILWGIGVWIVTSRQRKELARTKARITEEEEKNKLMATMKEQLEVQVAERTEEITKQKEALETALEELKATQAQLIQSEKMASLGELTAGIAHEIQNPLNFVNNFSEVSNELMIEMKDELAKGNQEQALEIADDIRQNLEKIAHHGKRADAIVKGMLQHSRASTGAMEPTDINDLCDEYFRLAFHGLRAKDKGFNAAMKMDFDPALTPDSEGNGKIKIIPQDIGRVVLNLLTNAFYEVHKKSKQSSGNISYEPTVTVSTKKSDKQVEIIIADNGNGIPEEVLSKIFQPFFTTKPTGEGTGLGLSLSYDIITKGHGGKIDVITNHDGKIFVLLNGVLLPNADKLHNFKKDLQETGTIFKIKLPIK